MNKKPETNSKLKKAETAMFHYMLDGGDDSYGSLSLDVDKAVYDVLLDGFLFNKLKRIFGYGNFEKQLLINDIPVSSTRKKMRAARVLAGEKNGELKFDYLKHVSVTRLYEFSRLDNRALREFDTEEISVHGYSLSTLLECPIKDLRKYINDINEKNKNLEHVYVIKKLKERGLYDTFFQPEDRS